MRWWRLMVAMFLMSSSLLIIAPLLPKIQEEHGLGVSSLGVISGVGLAVGLVSEIFLAPFADRGHEKRMMVMSIILAAVALAWLGAADSLWSMIASRSLAGVAYGMFTPVAGAIIVRTTPDKVGEGMGKLQAADLAGLAGGPFIAAGLTHYLSLSVSLWISAGLVVALVPFFLTLPVSPRAAPDTVVMPDAESSLMGESPSEETGATKPATRPPLLAFDLLSREGIRCAAVVAVAMMLPIGVYDTIWSRWLFDLGASSWLLALSLGLFALPFVVVAPFAGKLVDRVGPARGSLWGLGIVTVSLVGYGLSAAPAVVIGVSMVEAIGQALAGPGSSALTAVASGPERAAAAQGLVRALGLGSAALAAFASGPLYSTFGALGLFGITAVIVGGLTLAGFGLLRAWKWMPPLLPRT